MPAKWAPGIEASIYDALEKLARKAGVMQITQ